MKKICCFGSANIDFVYHMPHFVKPGETLGCEKRDQNAGGKGANQSCALSHAGAKVYFAGNIGADGAFLRENLNRHGVDTSLLRTVDTPTGHAIIQVEESGENCIILYGGANQCVDEAQIEAVLSFFAPGDLLVLQNEVNGIDLLIRSAKEKGMQVALNPSPIAENILSLPLETVDYLFVNETEGEAISGVSKEDPKGILAALCEKYPATEVILTLGSKGAVCGCGGAVYASAAVSSVVVDTTAAGDTFTGYYLTLRAEGESVRTAMDCANLAASVTVSRKGASDSIPWRRELRSACSGNARPECLRRHSAGASDAPYLDGSEAAYC